MLDFLDWLGEKLERVNQRRLFEWPDQQELSYSPPLLLAFTTFSFGYLSKTLPSGRCR